MEEAARMACMKRTARKNLKGKRPMHQLAPRTWSRQEAPGRLFQRCIDWKLNGRRKPLWTQITGTIRRLPSEWRLWAYDVMGEIIDQPRSTNHDIYEALSSELISRFCLNQAPPPRVDAAGTSTSRSVPADEPVEEPVARKPAEAPILEEEPMEEDSEEERGGPRGGVPGGSRLLGQGQYAIRDQRPFPR